MRGYKREIEEEYKGERNVKERERERERERGMRGREKEIQIISMRHSSV